MGMYCLNMLAIALELAKDDPLYEDVASKFLSISYTSPCDDDFGSERCGRYG